MDHLPFSFHKQHHVTTDTEKAYHDIRLNQSEDVYIELHFQGANRYSPFLTVLEENPYVPDDVELTKVYDEAATFILQRSLISYQRERLTNEIDRALDEKDQDRFITLLLELKKLDEEKEKKLDAYVLCIANCCAFLLYDSFKCDSLGLVSSVNEVMK